MPELPRRRKSQLARELIESGLIDEIRVEMERAYFDAWCRLQADDLTPSGLHARAQVLRDVMTEFSKLATDHYLHERDNTATAAG